MSEIRVNKIEANKDSISFTGITTFSGTGAFGLPGGGISKRPEVSKEGQVRYINGDIKKGLEYYNGTEWITTRVANGESYEGITPIGVFGGGVGATNVIDYITISSLSNATDFGDLTVAKFAFGACSSSTRGVFAGGATPTSTNVIEYITITTTGNAQDFGDLTSARSTDAGCSSSTRGIFGNGTTIDYITIATIGNSQTFGSSFQTRGELASCSSSTRGVFAGGATPTIVNTIDYITIATTGNALDFGDLFQSRVVPTGCSSSTRGIFSGGRTQTTPTEIVTNVIDYITIASQGTNASDFGDLLNPTMESGSCSSSTRGVIAGGYVFSPINADVNIISYITISTIGNALDFGDLISARRYLSGLSNNHGGLLAS